MTEALQFVPPRVPLTEPNTGIITREWYLFLQGIFIRIGGSIGASTTDLSTSTFEDAGIEETKAALFIATQDAGQAPSIVIMTADAWADLLAQISGIQDQIAELSKDIQGLRQSTLI